MYDGVFEVLQWLLFLSAVPPVQLLTGWCVTAKALPDISAISALTA
ncbi:hypothetical protein EAJG_02221, partial [Escherichia coli E267]